MAVRAKRKKNVSGTGRWDRSMPQEARWEEQRLTILFATARTVAELGFSKTRLADIERASNMSRRTIFSHFPTMEELFIETHKYAAELAQTLVLQAARTARAPREKVRAALDAYFALIEEHSGFAAALLRDFAALGSRHVAVRATLIDALADFIIEVAAEFNERSHPSKRLASALIVSIEAAAPVIALEPDASIRADAKAALERMLLVGMGQTL